MGRASAFVAPDLINTGILDQAVTENGWKQPIADQARVWYDRFLELCYDNPGRPVPILTQNADKLWHTHITFTKQYTNYCMAILGFYLDHIPNVPRRAPTPAEVAAARALYAKFDTASASATASAGNTASASIITPDMIIQCTP